MSVVGQRRRRVGPEHGPFDALQNLPALGEAILEDAALDPGVDHRDADARAGGARVLQPALRVEPGEEIVERFGRIEHGHRPLHP